MISPGRPPARDDRPKGSPSRKIRFDAPHKPVPAPQMKALGGDAPRPHDS